MRQQWSEVWRFKTARFAIVAEVTDCEDDPADSFEFPQDIEAVRNGSVAWFDARVRVLLRNDDGEDSEELGADYLGACAYDRPIDLFRHHATLVAELRRLRGKTDRKSRRDRKALRACLANNLQLNPPVTYCEYGPDMVRQAIREARANVARMASLGLRQTSRESVQ